MDYPIGLMKKSKNYQKKGVHINVVKRKKTHKSMQISKLDHGENQFKPAQNSAGNRKDASNYNHTAAYQNCMVPCDRGPSRADG